MSKINDEILNKSWINLSQKNKEEKIRDIWNKKFKKLENDFGDEDSFKKWYLKQDRKCFCCNVSEEDVKMFFYSKDNLVKAINRHGKRGRILEIDKEDNFKPYGPNNCHLLCYVCNNAKSNFIDSYEDFKPISDGIKEFWKSKGIKID